MEDNKMQPESFNNETHQPDEIVQPEAATVDKGTQSPAASSQKKNSPATSYAIVALIFLLLMAVVSIGGLGYWGYSLGNNLTTTQQQLIELQGNYDTLLAQSQKLSTDLVETNTELIETKLELDATKAKLSTSSQELAKKNKSIKDAAARLVVLRKMLNPLVGGDDNVTNEEEAAAFFLDWIQSIEDVNDPTLKVKFEDFLASLAKGDPNEADFFTYLLQTIEADLK